MGNIEFKDAFRKVAEPDFDANAFEANFGHLLLKKNKKSHDKVRFEETAFTAANGQDKWFKTGCTIEEALLSEQNEEASGERFKEELLKDIAIGYTSSENKLHQLKMTDFEKFRFQNDPRVVSFEEKQRFRNIVLLAHFYAKSRGGLKVDQNLKEMMTEKYAALDTTSRISSTLSTNPIMLALASQSLGLTKNQEFVKTVLKQFLLEWPQMATLEGDHTFMRINQPLRDFLCNVLDDAEMDAENRQLALKVFLQVGMTLENPLHLVLCAFNALKYGIDISQDLEKYCSMPEVYPFEKGDDNAEPQIDLQSTQVLNSRLSFGDEETTPQISFNVDAFALDETHVYNYNTTRGLIRANITVEGAWNSIEVTNKDLVGLHSVSMVCVGSHLLMRHRALRERPFLILDKETLLEASDADHQITSVGDDAKKLDWSICELPEQPELKRSMEASPLAFDGKYIYAVSTRRDKYVHKTINAFVLDVYELKKGQLSLVRHVYLVQSDMINQLFINEITAKKSIQVDGGILDQAQLACNGDFIALHLIHETFFFNVRTGRQVAKIEHKAGFQMAYDPVTHRLMSFETMKVGGAQSRLTLKEFVKPRYTMLKQTVPPAICTKVKAQIKAEIEAAKKSRVQVPLIDSSRVLFRRQNKLDDAMAVLEENLKNQAESSIDSVVEASVAILLSSMAYEGDSVEIEVNKNQGRVLFMNDLEKFLFKPNSVFLNEMTFVALKQLIELLVTLHSSGKVNNFTQVALLAAIKLLKTNLKVLKMTKIPFSELLEPADLESFNTFSQDCLSKIEDYGGDGDKDDSSLDLVYQRVIQWHSRELSYLLNQVCNSISPISKFDEIDVIFEKDGDNEANGEQITRLLQAISNTQSIREILQNSHGETKKATDAYSGFLEWNNKQTLAFLFDNSQEALQNGNEMSSTSVKFIKEFTEVVMVQYGLYCQEIQKEKRELKEAKQQGKDPFELQIVQSRLDALRLQFANLESHFFTVFESLAKSVKDLFNAFAERQSPKMTSVAAVYDHCDRAAKKLTKVLFAPDSSLYLLNAMILALQIVPIGTQWLDEVSDGLKTSLHAYESYLRFTENVDPAIKVTLIRTDTFLEHASKQLKRVSYAIGFTAAKLIKTEKVEEDGEMEAKREALTKLPIIKGGIESKFIPALSQGTKDLIEGFFKITQDPELRELALSDPNMIEMSEDDALLDEIFSKTKNDEEDQLASMLEDYTELTLAVLQQGILTKVPPCPQARIAGENGLRLTRAAFAACLKLSESLDSFRTLRDDIENEAMMDISEDLTLVQREKSILQKLKDSKSTDLVSMMAKWESASEIRRWINDKKSFLSQDTVKEAKENLIKEINLSDPSYDGKFEGPLSPEQDALVEERAYEELERRLQSKIRDVSDKARFLLKMSIPDEFQQAKKQEQAEENRRQLSAQSMNRQGSLMRRQSLTSGLQRNESTQDWSENLQNWQQMQFTNKNGQQMNEFGGAGVSSSISCSLMVLQCLKADYSATELGEYIERQMIGGLRRAAGLNLLNFAMSASTIPDDYYFILLQWFQSTLRGGTCEVVHFMDQVSGCGQHVHSIARKEFFSILASVLEKLKTREDGKEIKMIINAFYWSYTGADLLELAKINLFEVLAEGDGSRTNPIRMAWGHMLEQSADQQRGDETLTHKIVKVFNFLFKIVLRSVVTEDVSFNVQEDIRQSAINLKQRNQTGLVKSAEKVMQQIFEVLFSNLKRYLNILETFGPGWQSQIEERHLEFMGHHQNQNDLLLDDFQYFEDNGGKKKIMQKIRYGKNLEVLKFDLLVSTLLAERESDPISGGVTTTLLVTELSSSLEVPNDSSVVEETLKRSVTVQREVAKLSFEQLSLTKPTPEQLWSYQKLQRREKVVKDNGPLPLKDNTASKKIDVSPKKRIQKLQQTWNTLAVVLDHKVDTKQTTAIYKKFLACLPLKWTHTLQTDALANYWSHGSSYFEQEFLPTEECTGISLNQVCVVTEQQEEFKDEVNNAMMIKREQRSELCSDCFWYRVLQNVLEANLPADTEQLQYLVDCLPDSCEIFTAASSQDLVKLWTKNAQAALGDNVENNKENQEDGGAGLTDKEMLRYPRISAKAKHQRIKALVEWITDKFDDLNANSESSGSENEERNFMKKHSPFGWRHFASYFPLQWCVNFEKQEFKRFRMENQENSDSDYEGNDDANNVDFCKVEDCSGSVRNMVCVSSSKNDTRNAQMGDAEHFQRSSCCRECYWYMTSLNCLMETDVDDLASDDDDDSSINSEKVFVKSLKKLIDQLPNSYDILASTVKPKYFWLQLFDIYDQIEKLRELTIAVLKKVASNDTERSQKVNLLRNFANEFSLDWLRAFGSPNYYAFRAEYESFKASGQPINVQFRELRDTAFQSTGSCQGFRRGFACVSSSTDPDDSEINDVEFAGKAFVCEKCYYLRTMLLILANGDASCLALTTQQEIESHKNVALMSRPFREGLNSMIQRLPLRMASLNLTEEVLFDQWLHNSPDKVTLKFTPLRKSLTVKNKLKRISKAVETVQAFENVATCDSDIGGNYNPKMGVPELKDLMRFAREFLNWFPEEFIDAAMAKNGENQDNVEYSREADCVGNTGTIPCLVASDDASIERNIAFWKGKDDNSSDDEKKKCCFKCQKVKIAVGFLCDDPREEDELTVRLLNMIPDDLPFFETDMLVLMYQKCAFRMPKKSRGSSKSSKSRQSSGSNNSVITIARTRRRRSMSSSRAAAYSGRRSMVRQSSLEGLPLSPQLSHQSESSNLTIFDQSQKLVRSRGDRSDCTGHLSQPNICDQDLSANSSKSSKITVYTGRERSRSNSLISLKSQRRYDNNSLDSLEVKPVPIFREMLTREEQRDNSFFSVSKFVNLNSEEQKKWLLQSEQEYLRKYIPMAEMLTGEMHGICEHEIVLIDEKQFWCDCPFKDELHYGFSEQFYNEEAKPWYRCNFCEKGYCGVYVQISQAQKGLNTGSDFMVNLVRGLIEKRRGEVEGQDLGQKLNNLRNLKVKGLSDKIGIQNLYHDSFLLRMLEMLDFFSSLAATSPATLALIQKFIEPRHLQYLLKLLTTGLPRMKTIAVKIFQNILQRQVPIEILNKAVETSLQSDEKIQEIMSMETGVGFDQSKAAFYKFVFNLLLSIKQKMWRDDAAESRGMHAFAQELARLFSSALISEDKIEGSVKGTVFKSLKKLTQLNDIEVETLMSVIPQTSLDQIQKGSPVINQSGQRMTILGFFGDDSLENASVENQRLRAEMTDEDCSKYVYGLYYNEKTPERQEVIIVKKQEMHVLTSLVKDDAEELALQSCFCDRDLVKHFLELLQEKSMSSDKTFQSTLIRNYLIRGFSSVISELKAEYVTILKRHGLSKDLLSQIISLAGQDLGAIKKTQLTSLPLLELQTDMIKQRLLLSENSIRETNNVCKFFLGADTENFVIKFTQQKRSTVFAFTVKSIQKADQVEAKYSLANTVLKQHEQITEQSQHVQNLVMMKSDDLLSLSKPVMQRLAKTNFVLISETVNLNKHLTALRKQILSASNVEAGKTSYIIVSDPEFTRLEKVLSQSFDQNVRQMQGEETDIQSIEDQLCKVMAIAEAKDITLDFAYSKLADMTRNIQNLRVGDSITDEIWQKLSKIYEETYTERFGADEFQRVNKTSQPIFAKIMEQTKDKVIESLTVVYDLKEKESAAKEEESKQNENVREEEKLDLDTNLPDFKEMLDDDIRLGNFATCHFESDQVAQRQQQVSQEEIQEKFNESIKVPEDIIDFRQTITSNLHTLTTMHSFNAFQNLIAFGYRDYSEVEKDLNQSHSMFQKLCNLIHQELKLSHMLWMVHRNKVQLKRAKEKTSKLLMSMFQNDGFKDYLLADLMSRGLLSAKKVLNHADFELMDLTVQNVGEMMDSDRALHPHVMIFLANQILNSSDNVVKEQPSLYLNLFNLVMSQMILFCGDSESRILNKLIKLSSHILQTVLKNVKNFTYEDQVVENIVNNKLLQMVSMGLDFDAVPLTDHKREFLSLQVMLFAIHDQVMKKKLSDFAISMSINKHIVNQFKARAIFQEGRKFNFMRTQMLMKHLMNGSEQGLVSKFSQEFKTDSKIFVTNFNLDIGSTERMLQVHFKNFSADGSIRVLQNNNEEISYNHQSFAKGLKNFYVGKNQKLKFEFPLKEDASSVKLLGEVSCRGNNDFGMSNMEAFQVVPDTVQCKASKIVACHNHVTIVGEDDSIWGFGYRTQGAGAENQMLRRIGKPETCRKYKKVVAGKFQRWILTEGGELFCNGQNKRRVIGVDALNPEQQFVKVTLPLEAGDRITDVSGGRHFMMACTEKGQIFGTGFQMYRTLRGNVQNALGSENQPYKINIQGFTVIKVFCSERYYVAFVLAKSDADGKLYSLAAGSESGCHGLQTEQESPSFQKMNVPANTYFTEIQCQGRNMWAIDNEDNLWTWGHRDQTNNFVIGDNQPRQPAIVKYFKDNGYLMTQLRAGYDFAVVRARKIQQQATQELFTISVTAQGDNSIQSKGEEVTNRIRKLSMINANAVVDFACGKQSILIINDSAFSKIAQVSIIPSNPMAKGFIHAWQNDDKANRFLTDQDYSESKNDLPQVSIAVRQPIKDYVHKATEIFDQIRATELDTSPFDLKIKSTLTGIPIPADQPLYYSFSDIGEQQQRIWLTEQEVLTPGHSFDINPLVYYRLAPGHHQFAKTLPKIDLSKLYKQSNGMIQFTVKRLQLSFQEETNNEILQSISEETRDKFNQLATFTEEMDSEIIRQVDKTFLSLDKDILLLSINDIDTSKFTLNEQNFKGIHPDVIKMRAELFIKFTKKFLDCRSWIQASPKDKDGSLGNDFLKSKSLVLATVKNQLLDEQIRDMETGPRTVVDVSRRKAQMFTDSGQVDHRGEKTIFGQTMIQIKRKQPDFSNFKQKGTDKTCWKINFMGEGSMDYGGPFRDSLVNISKELESGVLPLLIKSANNRTECGLYRECFVLNPEANSPTHLEMMHFLGCIIGFGIMSKSPIPLNLAPTVWKQLLGETMNWADLDSIDTLSAQALKDIQEKSKTMGEEEFAVLYGEQAFFTVLSNGTEVALCEGGYQKMLTVENAQEFINLVLKARQNENKEQIQELRRGVQTVLGDLTALSLMEWHQIEIRACGEKTINIDKLKSITEYPRCPKEHRVMRMFWRVFETRFTEEERQLYLKFVWGRTRLPIDLTNLSNKHQLRLFPSLNKTGFPIAHTCFFQLDIPEYPDDDICYTKFVQAITMCGTVDIDTDNIANESD